MNASDGWKPGAGHATARTRAWMLSAARHYFANCDVLEVETPVLSASAVSDPHLESMHVSAQCAEGGPLFLRTSPEYPMKRLLAAGYPDIFEIGKVFRDGERGARHQPEFTMIEWYRHGFGLQQIIDDAVGLISTLIDDRHLLRPLQQISYRDAFLRFAGVDPGDAQSNELARIAKADDSLMRSIGDDRDAWLDLILARNVAAAFPSNALTVLHHYPASQAALSRLCPDDPALADRFEVFFGPVELANGYVELTDADEQRRRFLRDQEQRRLADAQTRPLDENLLAAMDHGLPPCAGVAVGFDRLLMINTQARHIRDVVSIAFEGRGND
ncbi:MAG: EF-P lysine aminoacylase GenX [Gammaproteobacteria bacterium]|nr:EF-P lysine aminoacylase GenX [Gammaproteobacteria bacterium]